MKTRFYIRGKDGSYCESSNRADLVKIRSNNPVFKGKHISNTIQAWSDIIKENIVYPPSCATRYDFILFNRNLSTTKLSEAIQTVFEQLRDLSKEELEARINLACEKNPERVESIYRLTILWGKT